MRGSEIVGKRLVAAALAVTAAVTAMAMTAACDRRDTVPALEVSPVPSAEPLSVQAEAEAFFLRTCAVCHGREGLGNGPAAGGLDVPPRKYADAAWQASITDEQIKRTILGGGASVGKDAAMPAHPQLAAQPELLDALVEKVRSFDPRR